jgi:putative tryptophan/tyrosine transport system substrate-binding protein
MLCFNFSASVILASLLSTLAIGCSSSLSSNSADQPAGQVQTKSVAVTQIVEHPALNATRDGLKAALAAGGYEVNKTLKWEWQSAQGNTATAVQIAKKFAGDQPDVIVAISTPSAQSVLAATKSVPIVFTAVTDPIGAKLVTNLEKPGGAVTGVSALVPVGQHLDLIAKITPQAKRIGVIYNAGEANSVTLVQLLKQEAPTRNMALIEATVSGSGDVTTAARSLVGKADAIYVPTDNTVASALESVLQVGINHKLPIYAGDNDSVVRGAIASLSFNYYEVGQQTGQVVLKILNGEKPGNIAVAAPTQLDLYVNRKSAQAMGVTVPPSVLSEAAKVIQ